MEENKKVIAWITSPFSCNGILKEAAQYSKQNNFTLVAVSVQNPAQDNFSAQALDLAVLEKGADEYKAEMMIEYSENPLKSVFEIINEIKPAAMFTGVAEIGKASAFLDNIRHMGAGIPTFTVDKNGHVICN